MELNNCDKRAKVLAFYLPQFYPTPFNNKYYGKGFTEWTNVGKAKPLYSGHCQPHIPTDLGYYDLRVPEVAEMQADLACEAGVFGFAYWHYWWSGDMELNMPAERMLQSGKPDFPFCFAWANENWYKKLWSKDKKDDILLKEQNYPGEEDNLKHFQYCLPFFKDKRYITFNGCPVFIIYHPDVLPDSFLSQWNALIKEAGIAEKFYFIGFMYREDEYDKLKDKGYDCLTLQHTMRTPMGWTNFMGHVRAWIQAMIGSQLGMLRFMDYKHYPQTIWKEGDDSREDIAPQIIPNWDNTPRAGRRGLVYKGATPEIFGEAANILMKGIQTKKNKLVFLKSWNEWAEGNYMEPDMQYGHGFIEALRRAIDGNMGK